MPITIFRVIITSMLYGMSEVEMFRSASVLVRGTFMTLCLQGLVEDLTFYIEFSQVLLELAFSALNWDLESG